MTAQEIKDFIDNGGEIDCGNDNEVKHTVLRILEELGYTIGVPKEDVGRYRYAYYSTIYQEIHMSVYSGTLYGGESPVISSDEIIFPTSESSPINTDELYDWVEFFSS